MPGLETGLEPLQLDKLFEATAFRSAGKLTGARGLLTTTLDAELGELCEIRPQKSEPVLAEVVGFQQGVSQLLPFRSPHGLRPGDLVVGLGRKMDVAFGDPLLGRVLDGLGEPIDGRGPIEGCRNIPVQQSTPSSMSRPRISERFVTGQRAIDGLITCGRGQRVALMAGSGVGKSTLLGEIARGSEADVNVVALIGERGREVRPFLDDCLGTGLEKSVVIVTTSEEAALMRVKAALSAMTIADGFRRQGKNVLLMIDSITRLAMAQREIGLSLGEPPSSRGYTPSVFQLLASFLEQLGTSPEGSITGLITVLVDGDDLDEPVTDAVRSIVDGHIVLSRKLAEKGQFPAIDVGRSVSRVSREVTTPQQQEEARRMRHMLATLSEVEDLVRVGAYESGSSPIVDRALALEPVVRQFVHQPIGSKANIEETLAAMNQFARKWTF